MIIQQIYTAIDRIKTYDNLYCIEQLKRSVIKVKKDTLLEYERLKQNNLFFTININTIPGNTVTVLAHNLRSLLDMQINYE